MKRTPRESKIFGRIVLHNWKNFLTADVALQNRAFLIGPNASGKSNFLDAFRFLRDLVSSGSGFQESVRRRGGVSVLRCLAARRNSDIEVGVEVKGRDGDLKWRYELAFNQDSQHRPLIRKEKVTRENETLLDRPEDEDHSDPERLKQTYLEQVNVNKPFREIVSFFESVRYLHIVPQLVREPDRSVGRSNDPFGGDFLEQLAKTPERTRNSRLRHIMNALRVAVPQLKDIEMFRDKKGTPHLKGRYDHWRSQGAWQTEEQFSDGTLRLMGLLWASMDGVGPMLLEEPELSLHPEVIHFLPQMFARVQRRTGRQIFLSTHSPELLADEGIGLDEVLLLRPSSEGTTVRPANQFNEIVHLMEGGLSLPEIVIPKTKPASAEQLTLFGDYQ